MLLSLVGFSYVYEVLVGVFRTAGFGVALPITTLYRVYVLLSSVLCEMVCVGYVGCDEGGWWSVFRCGGDVPI